jgi:hypothetical protein
MKNITLLILLTFFILPVAAQETSEETGKENENQTSVVKHPILTEKFLMGLGLFSPFNKVVLGADGELDTENTDDIRFDEQFQLDGVQNSFTLNFNWRFSKNYSVSADYFSVRTSKTRILDKTIEWNGKTYEADASVTGGYEFALYRIFFGRVISRGNKHEFGGGLGFHTVRIGGFIDGRASVNGVEGSFERNKVQVTLPLPNIGFWYFWAPDQKWAFTGRVDWFGVSISNFSGNLWGLTPGVNYQAFKNIGFSVEYKYLSLKADVDKDVWKGNFGMDFYGPSFKVTANF